MSGTELWETFLSEKGIHDCAHSEWSFGSDADQLAALVADGSKTATASAYPLYELEGEALPQVGDYNIILNSKDEGVCIVQTTKVYVTPFHCVTKEHAWKEGEGDRSLDYWKRVHAQFFTECLDEVHLSFSEDMDVVCEEFELVFKA